ncbi:MAG: hypothetical protein FJW37_01305 [Acidobacteria bacterium]|nr:hypothetical protein [Acidobacteriota bacterium]
MDLNLDTLRREILEYMDNSGLVVFHSSPGGLEGLPVIAWDVERYPDYQMFLEVAKKAGAGLVLFASTEFAEEELEEALEELEQSELPREDRRDLERRLRDLRVYLGVTCSLELAFDADSRLYLYEVRPDWYDEFLSTCDEIAARLPGGEDEEDELGGYFSRN